MATGEAQSRLEEHVSKEQLKEKLRRQAVINAIENEFGAHISQETFINIDEGSPQFRIEGNTTVRGEWLKTIREEYTEELRQGQGSGGQRHEIWIRCSIKGKIRKIVQPQIDYWYKTSNCPEASCETSLFRNGESLYLNFLSPARGYLSVYIVEGDNAHQVLPYQQMDDVYPNYVPVEANKSYVFFSSYREHDYYLDFSHALADELLMVTDKPEEFVTLYLVFSTDEYTKPAITRAYTVEEGLGVPKSLPFSQFKEWLEDNRIHNINFYYCHTTMKIVNKAAKP
jgi:hypothetical protein